MLEAAMAAPSSSNRKPWHFIVVTGRVVLDKLAKIHLYARAKYLRGEMETWIPRITLPNR